MNLAEIVCSCLVHICNTIYSSITH